MDRNNTSFPLLINAKLKKLFDAYQIEREKNDEHSIAANLKYYQYFVRVFMKENVIKSRGMLIFASPGTGKSRLGAAVASVLNIKTIILAPQGLHNNFRQQITMWEEISHEKIKHIKYVSSNAFNSGDQFDKINIENTLLIIDEAHLFFKAVINSGDKTNARRIYDKIMRTKNIKLLFLTGTPISKDIFELVPCFNMLTGTDLFPTQYDTFCQFYIDKSTNSIINKEKFMNRIIGLVSHVDFLKLSSIKPRDDGGFPEDLGTIIERVEMSQDQYKQYLLYRHKEDAENKRDAMRRKVSKPLSLPASQSGVKTYYVKSRMCSDFYNDLDIPISELPDSAFTQENSPKLYLIASRLSKCNGKAIAYSQFVERGLNPLGRYLELLNFEQYDMKHLTKSRKHDNDVIDINHNDNIDINDVIDINHNDEIDNDDVIDINDVIDEKDDENNGIKQNTKLNSKSEFNTDLRKHKLIEAGHEYKHRTVSYIDTKSKQKQLIDEEIQKNTRHKKIKFAKHLCEYNDDQFIDPVYEKSERELIKKVISESQNIYEQRYYNPSDKVDFKYRQNKGYNIIHNQLHHGQRKLFLSELQLLTETLKSFDIKATILYAGSAPCVHLPYLALLFPNLRFILWDPAPYAKLDQLYAELIEKHKNSDFYIPSKGVVDRFEIHNDFFTDAVADNYHNKVDYFISDIRLGVEMHGEKWTQEFEDQIAKDMNAQMIWTQKINPKIASLLKYRLPYINTNEKLDVEYMKGRVMVQTWPSKSSTETRLLTLNGEYNTMQTFHVDHYQNWLSYHNQIIRQWVVYDLNLDYKTFNVDGFDRCFDCANEYVSWKEYIEFKNNGKFKANMDIVNDTTTNYIVAHYMNNLTKNIHQSLLSPKENSIHGYMSNIPMCSKRKKIYNAIFSETMGGNIKKSKYIIISGAIDKKIQQQLIDIFNSDENINGEIIKVILMSEVGASGLDLKTVMQTHQIEPYWEGTRAKQFKHRAIRMGSHDQLPKEQREVQSYIYLSTANKFIQDSVLDKENETIDEYFYSMSVARDKIKAEGEELLANVSFECQLFNYGNCRICAATNKELFNTDPASDILAPDMCKSIENETVTTKKITFNDKIYYYIKDDNELLGYKFYEYSDDYNGFIQIMDGREELYDVADLIDSQ